MDDKSKLAALAGVMAYIKEEEDAMCLAAAMQGPIAERMPAPQAPPKLWGGSGRQAMMQNRNLMQAKAFHR